jgi:hypothetical protein
MALALRCEVTLWIDRGCRGVDDERLRVDSGAMMLAHRASALLPRCLPELKLWQHEPHALVRSCREAILLHLYRATVGDSIVGVFRCTMEDGEPLDLALRLSDLARPFYQNGALRYRCDVQHDGVHEAWSRFATAADQKDTSELPRSDPESAVRRMMGRGIESAPRLTKDFGVSVESAHAWLIIASDKAALAQDCHSFVRLGTQLEGEPKCPTIQDMLKFRSGRTTLGAQSTSCG